MIIPHHGKWPVIHETAFVAPSVDIVGDVEIGAESTVWFQSVIRGDVNPIRIGSRTNVQDHCVLHVTRKKHGLSIGDDVTVGHRVVLHGCTIGSRVLVGMGSVVMDGVEVGDDSMIGAGSLLTPGKKFPPRTLIMGSPAKAARPLEADELAFLKKSAENYVADGREYRSYVRGPARLGDDKTDLESLYIDDEEVP